MVAVRNHIRLENEYRIVLPSGEVRWINALGNTTYDANGRALRMSGICLDITDRKHAEEAIERQRRIHQVIIDKSHTHLVYLDTDFNFVSVNTAYSQTCLRTPEELIGKNHFHFFPHEENEEIFRWVRDTGQPVSFHDKPFEFPDQPERGITYWDWTLSPVLNDSGKVEGLVFSLIETTERKRIEDQLRESEANLIEAQRIAHIGSWQWDMVSNNVKWSKEMFRIFDLNPDTYDGKPESLLQVIHPEDVDLFAKSMKSNLSNGNSPSLEYRVIYKDGSIHTIFAEGIMEFNKEGKPIKSSGTVQDITDRKQAEEALRDSEELFHSAFFCSPNAIAISRQEDGVWIDVNPGAVELFGYTREEAIGTSALTTNLWVDLKRPAKTYFGAE